MSPQRASRSARTDNPQAREHLLDVAERLMSAKGYAATPVSAICKEVGVAPTSLYWHFGSKEGLLASVMERGAQRWFATLPRWEDLTGAGDERAAKALRHGAAAVGDHPVFLRLFYILALEASGDPVASDLVRQVRDRARDYFAHGIRVLLGDADEPDVVQAAVTELARFAVAFSDGCFFASQLEPGEVDLQQMYADLVAALIALAPTVLDRVRAGAGQADND
ncbi:TetR/AcrR family transcriptional regulator [Nocardia asteroides]